MNGEQMFVKYGYSNFRSDNPVWPMAIKRQLTYHGKQVWLSTSTKKKQKIRKVGMLSISIIITAMLIILGKIS